MIRWNIINPTFLSNADLAAEHEALQDCVDDQRKEALVAEIRRRGQRTEPRSRPGSCWSTRNDACRLRWTR